MLIYKALDDIIPYIFIFSKFLIIRNRGITFLERLLLLTLDEFIKSDYINLLTDAQRKYLIENGHFKDMKVVKNRLSKYYKNVSISKKYGRLVISIGKPRVKTKDDKLQQALVSGIVASYDYDNPQSLSKWLDKFNIQINHGEVEFESSDVGKMFGRTKGMVESKQIAWFQSAFNAFSKRVGNGYILIPYCAESVADKYGSGEHIEVRPLDHYERFEVRRLKEDLEEKGLRDPRMQRESKEWEDLLARLGLVNIYNVYEVAGLKEDELSSLRENQGVVTFDARNLFITKFDSWIGKKIKEFYKDEGIKSAVDAGIISGSNSGLKYPTIKEWVQFKPLIFRDSVSEKLLDDVKYMDSDDLFKMFGIDEEE